MAKEAQAIGVSTLESLRGGADDDRRALGHWVLTI
jgi:hypothetical protein